MSILCSVPKGKVTCEKHCLWLLLVIFNTWNDCIPSFPQHPHGHFPDHALLICFCSCQPPTKNVRSCQFTWCLVGPLANSSSICFTSILLSNILHAPKRLTNVTPRKIIYHYPLLFLIPYLSHTLIISFTLYYKICFLAWYFRLDVCIKIIAFTVMEPNWQPSILTTAPQLLPRDHCWKMVKMRGKFTVLHWKEKMRKTWDRDKNNDLQKYQK